MILKEMDPCHHHDDTMHEVPQGETILLVQKGGFDVMTKEKKNKVNLVMTEGMLKQMIEDVFLWQIQKWHLL